MGMGRPEEDWIQYIITVFSRALAELFQESWGRGGGDTILCHLNVSSQRVMGHNMIICHPSVSSQLGDSSGSNAANLPKKNNIKCVRMLVLLFHIEEFI